MSRYIKCIVWSKKKWCLSTGYTNFPSIKNCFSITPWSSFLIFVIRDRSSDHVTPCNIRLHRLPLVQDFHLLIVSIVDEYIFTYKPTTNSIVFLRSPSSRNLFKLLLNLTTEVFKYFCIVSIRCNSSTKNHPIQVPARPIKVSSTAVRRPLWTTVQKKKRLLERTASRCQLNAHSILRQMEVALTRKLLSLLTVSTMRRRRISSASLVAHRLESVGGLCVAPPTPVLGFSFYPSIHPCPVYTRCVSSILHAWLLLRNLSGGGCDLLLSCLVL